MFAWIFRTLNAHIITTRLELVRKPLKVLFLVSQFFAKRSQRTLKNKTQWTVINNFDSNLKLKVDRSRMMGASFFWTGLHEVREFIFLHRYLKKEMVALDIGANLGEYTLFMAKRLPLGRVFSFEPMKDICHLLRENVTLNNFNNVTIFEYGLSDKNQTMFLHEIDDGNEGLGTFYPGAKKSTRAEEILLRSLDQKFPSFDVARLDFIKMDVEGAELFALKGAKNTIQKFRPLVMVEISEENYRAAGYATSDVMNYFNELNYNPHQVNKTGDLVICNALPSFGNVIFVPR